MAKKTTTNIEPEIVITTSEFTDSDDITWITTTSSLDGVDFSSITTRSDNQ